ncbi:MAG TPA: DUF2269 domain-containing protein [Deltaproteobacteria bacterium]|nr:MAG: hypothetical protein A2Z79_02805 [Deltaproteobacteria bacterium GWA2_55_82]OGQ64323.1 MAG: hypothetical protein A3I81_04335 [Deltaproteobacteria bacterium RIFCSPLOWO2_02_FULL_55_12]OIJ74331.1 MAG: hypothetical protein A2V21_308705 [Deltaproteobacteria bacterium GWC2_55_46]HBG46973.1 DUF2269 domain-containing protein [Deltaproteobacteria bacterium]HCY10969.1 DUF2269 domain-containing protein [Deltaproteobacteria bacterium]
MTYTLLRFAHVLGAVMIGGGLIGVWLSDLRSRQIKDPALFSEAARAIAIFYDGVVVPGALLLLFSGAWMTTEVYGWGFIDIPWLAGMIALFSFEFIEGNTITRIYFMRIRRLSREAAGADHLDPRVEKERGRLIPAFTHFLDLPLLVLIIALGVIRPDTWTFFVVGLTMAVGIAVLLTIYIRRRYPGGQAD